MLPRSVPAAERNKALRCFRTRSSSRMRCVVLGVQRDEDLVEVLAPALRGSFHNLDIIRRKDRYQYGSEQLVVAAQGLAVQLHLVPTRDVYFGFDKKSAALPVRSCPQHCLLRAAAHKRGRRRPAKTPESGEISRPPRASWSSRRHCRPGAASPLVAQVEALPLHSYENCLRSGALGTPLEARRRPVFKLRARASAGRRSPLCRSA